VKKEGKMSKKNIKYWNFKNSGERTADLKIYGEISKYSWWDDSIVTASDFVSELENLEEIDTLNLCINSLGGSVIEANTIYNAIKRYAQNNSVKVITHIDGVAASAASFIAMAGDEICIGIGASLMIHNVQGGSSGESRDLRRTADLMDKLKDNIIDIYRTQSNLSREEISNLMNETTWMTAEEALENGFVDKIETYEDITDKDLDNLFTKEITNSISSLPPRVYQLRNEAKNKKTNREVIMSGINMTQEEFDNKIAQAKQEERDRIKALDNIYAPTEESQNMVNEAKYDKPQSPQEVAYNIMSTDSFKAHKEVSALTEEQKKSGAASVVNESPKNTKEKEVEDISNTAAQIARMANEARGF
jgi:ATP-dependent protease ClpP protease subunit